MNSKRPTESGYYNVIWEKGRNPVLVYLNINNDGYISWGHNENDDFESIELDIEYPENILFSNKIKTNEQ